jgi:uncharacterized protein (DUF2147 family)
MKVLCAEVPFRERVMIATLCLCVSVMASCAQWSIKASDIVGTWVEHRDSKLVAGSRPLARFTFTSDGRFEVTNLPRRFIDREMRRDDFITSIDGAGTWQLNQYDPYRNQYGSVELHFAFGTLGTSGYNMPILISTYGQTTLFFWLGEEGEGRFEFVKGTP